MLSGRAGVNFLAVQKELECLFLGNGTDRLSRKVGNYQSTPLNIPEDRRYTKRKVFFSLLRAMRAYRAKRGTDPLILNLGTRRKSVIQYNSIILTIKYVVVL